MLDTFLLHFTLKFYNLLNVEIKEAYIRNGLTFSGVQLKNNQTYFKNLVVFTLQEF